MIKTTYIYIYIDENIYIYIYIHIHIHIKVRRRHWEAELQAMAFRVLEMRSLLRRGLEDKGTPGTWNHITQQIGIRRGTNEVSTNGVTTDFISFDRGTFWVLPLAYGYSR